MNNINLIGRLTKDPEVRHLDGGNAVARFTLAVDKGLNKDKRAEFEAQGKPTADFISCIAWGNRATMAERNLKKGMRVGISGRLETGSYEAQDGSRRYTADVNVGEFAMIDWPERSNATSNQMPEQNQAQQFNVEPDFGFGDGNMPF